MPVPDRDRLLEAASALPVVTEMLAALADAGAPRVYLVGGAVRDLLLGQAPADIDLCVEGPIGPLLELLPGNVTRHQRFETATVMIGGMRCDIARARRETYTSPGALPVIEPADIAADIQRRDFTVNAIAMALTGGRAGQLISAADALEHLASRRLEILHPRSFVDDPTRLFRLARYAARLRFSAGIQTARAAKQAILDHVLGTISGSRVGNELRLVAAEVDPVGALGEMAKLGLDEAIHPEFGLGPEHSERAAFTQEALALLPEEGRRDLLVISACVLNVPAQAAGELLRRLAFPASDRAAIQAAGARSVRLSLALRSVARPSEIAAAVGSAAPEEVALAGALGARQQAWEWLERLRHLKLQIDGADLIAEGVPEGPTVGAALAAAHASLLDGQAVERDMQLRIALDAARNV